MQKTHLNLDVDPSVFAQNHTVKELRALCDRYGIKKGESEKDLTYNLASGHGVDGEEVTFDVSIFYGAKRPPRKNPNPWPDFHHLESDLSGNYMRTRCMMEEAVTGDIIGLPYHGKHGLRIDRQTNKATMLEFPWNGYVGSTTTEDGVKIACPAYADGFAMMQPDGKWDYNIGAKYQIRDCDTGPGGFIFGASYTTAPRVVRLNHRTKALTSIEYDRDSTPVWGGHWGAVGVPPQATSSASSGSAPDNSAGSGDMTDRKIYLLPCRNDRLGIIDKQDAARELAGHVTGGPDCWRYVPKYTHGVWHSDSGLVVCLPRQANAVLVIDPTSDSWEEIPLPRELIKLFGRRSKSFGSWIGPDGLVYGGCWQAPILFRFNPETRSIDWKDFTDEFAATNWVNNGTGISSVGLNISDDAGERVYLGPGAGDAVAFYF